MRPRTLVIGAALLAAACSGGRRGEPFVGPLALQTAAEKQGQRVYVVHCNQCHPGGEAGLGPALNDKPAPKVLIRTQVRAGLGAMPAFGPDKISDEELDALLDYMIALRKHRG